MDTLPVALCELNGNTFQSTGGHTAKLLGKCGLYQAKSKVWRTQSTVWCLMYMRANQQIFAVTLNERSVKHKVGKHVCEPLCIQILKNTHFEKLKTDCVSSHKGEESKPGSKVLAEHSTAHNMQQVA